MISRIWQEKRQEVIDTLIKEKAFRQTLRKGLNEFDKLILRLRAEVEADSKRTPEFKGREGYLDLPGEFLFKLYDTYGFPVELSKEEAFKRDINVKEDATEEFERLMQEQRARSQTAAKGTFKGGLGSGQTMHSTKSITQPRTLCIRRLEMCLAIM